MSNQTRLTRLFELARDPLRIEIITMLTLEPATAAELAAELGASVEQVRYQLKRLRQAGLVEIRGQRERRGALEHLYFAGNRQGIYTKGDLLDFESNPRQKHELEWIPAFFRDVLAAARAGVFESPGDYTVVRIHLGLDQQGFDEISALAEAVLTRLFEIREESLARLKETGEDPAVGNSMLLFFESREPQQSSGQ